ncbi:MAG: T9SS type A sorting domain-containing protein, partial [Prolixibacteraceae bacterium]|nr:T9SS type A sorting domain-containing protein [Prolixibacteraceae bacterium]
ISLGMYDLNGKLVYSIDNGLKRAGLYKATFDTSEFPEGIYLVRLRSPGFNGMQKVVLIK